MDWIVFAIGSAFFAGITSILAKIGVRNVNSDVMEARNFSKVAEVLYQSTITKK